MYDSEDIQRMLESLQDSSEREKFNKLLEKTNFSDRNAINHCIDECWYETFERYDSDVCEQFISLYEKYKEGE